MIHFKFYFLFLLTESELPWVNKSPWKGKGIEWFSKFSAASPTRQAAKQVQDHTTVKRHQDMSPQDLCRFAVELVYFL